jgi:phenylacetate-CoA ligase
MFETTYAQLRFAASILFAQPFHLPSLNRLIEACLDTQREFGRLTPEANEMLGGPFLDENSRREIQLRRFRTQAIRAVQDTPYYADLFNQLGLEPKCLTWEDIARLPLTTKSALRDYSDAFIRRSQNPTLRTTTTGTTGNPTCMVFTRHEMDTYIALGALTYLLQNSFTPHDVVQVSTSARALLGNSVFMGACQRVGALVYQTGLTEPEQALLQLAGRHNISGKKPQASILLTYPSYLGKLVETGLRLGYKPADFGLERIHLGGEIVTAGVKRRCQTLFGDIEIQEGYGITEAWPINGQVCEQGHLHFEPTTGLVEVINPDTSQAAKPGEVGSLVLTPFAPYRESMVLLRYDSEDLVRVLAEPLTCSLRHIPATGRLLGKKRLSVRHAHGWTYPRDVLEAIEAINDIPLPARCGFWPHQDGVAVEVATPTVGPGLRRQIEAQLRTFNVPLQALHLTTGPAQLTHPLPWRGDLYERSFEPAAKSFSWPDNGAVKLRLAESPEPERMR